MFLKKCAQLFCCLLMVVSVADTGLAQRPNAFNDAMGKILSNPGKVKAKPSAASVLKQKSGLAKIAASQALTVVKTALTAYEREIEENSILTPHLRCAYTRKHTMIWRDKGTGGAFDLGVWRPIAPNGWVILGDLAVPSMSDKCPDAPALLVKWDDNNPAGDEKGPFLKKPVNYTWLWDDKKSGADWDGSFWYPVPPEGYVSLGVVTQRNHSKPTDMGIMRCVRKDLVVPGKYIGHIWTDRKSGAKNDCAVWSQTVADSHKNEPYLVPNTFHVRGDYNNQPSAPAYAIKGLSGQDAYNDVYNGYLDMAKRAIVARTHQAVENAYLNEQADLKKQSDELQKKLDVVVKDQPSKPVLDNKEESIEGGTTATHPLTKVAFSSSAFAESAKKLKDLGDKIGLDKVPGLDKLPFVKGVEVHNVVFSQGEIAAGDEKGQPWMCISGNAELTFNQFGKVAGKIMVLSRLYKELGLRTGFVVILPTDTVLGKLPGMKNKPMNMLKFSDAAVTYASEEHEWLFSDLPDPVKDNFKEFSGSNSSTFNFDKGENVWLVSEIKNNTLLAAPFSVINSAPPAVLFTAVFPQAKEESFKLRAKLLNTFDPKFLPPGKFLKLSMPSLEISVGDFQGISILADLTLALSKKLNLTLPAKIDFPLNCSPMSVGVSVSGLIPGTWNNPFGIKGLSIGKMSIAGTFGKLPNLSLAGVIDLGSGYRFDLAGAFSFESPIALSALRCKLDRDLSLGDLIKIHGILLKVAFPKVKIPDLPSINLPLDELKIRNPEFCISEVDVPALNIQQGITVKGILALGAVDLGGTDFWMQAEKGVRCKAWVKGFKIGGLGISGAGPDKKDFTSDDCPIIDLEYWPPTTSPYTLKQHCYISGRAEILKAHMNFFVDVAKDRLKVDLTGDFGKTFNVHITGEGEHSLLKDISKGGSLKCTGEIKSDFIGELEKLVLGKVSDNTVVKTAVDLIGGAILKIKSISFTASLDDLAKAKLLEVKALCSAFGMSFTVSTPVNIPDNAFKENLGKVIAREVVEKAGDLAHDPIAFIGNVCGKIVDFGEEVSGELIKAFGRSPEENWNNVKNEAAKQAGKAKVVAEEGAKFAEETAKNLANQAEKIGKKVLDTMADIASGAWDTFTSWF